MTVQELIDSLGEMDPNAEVRLAFQPGHPLQFMASQPVQVDGTIIGNENVDEPKLGTAVYIGEAGEVGYNRPYLEDGVSEALGWR